jgi:hypothetical protein
MDDAEDEDVEEDEGDGVDEEVVHAVVVLADAIAHPGTMMVESFYAVVARVAVRASWRPEKAAYASTPASYTSRRTWL